MIKSLGILVFILFFINTLLKSIIKWLNQQIQREYPLNDSPLISSCSSKIVLSPHKTYRIFFKRLSQTQRSKSIPLMVFIHGLGGQIIQWEDQLQFFSSQNVDLLAVDLLGHGQSSDSPSTSDYGAPSLASDINEIIKRHLIEDQKVVLVAHSFGCAISAILYQSISAIISSVILLAPRYVHHIPLSQRIIPWIMPQVVFDLFRIKQRQGELQSKSIKSFISEHASKEIRIKQYSINARSRSHTLLKVFRNLDKFPNDEVYNRLRNTNVLLITGEYDKLTPVLTDSIPLKRSLGNVCTFVLAPNCGHNVQMESPELVNQNILNFLSKFSIVSQNADEDDGEEICEQMSQEKWSLKNYEKWKATVPVSELVGDSNIRGMKVLRQEDSDHSPQLFCQKYPKVKLVIDISKDTPPYETDLLKFGVQYIKIGTTSKIPPSKEETNLFQKTVEDFMSKNQLTAKDFEIAVHCHYGFNRTGMMVCSYLIEQFQIQPQEAMDLWQKARPPGIKHAHFREELLNRYSKQ